MNILSAQITPQERGKLTMDISGSKKNLDKGIHFLSELGIDVCHIAQEIRWDETRCIECTACNSICPTGALSVSRPQMRVSFNKVKCIACEICIPACPYAAIEREPDTMGWVHTLFVECHKSGIAPSVFFEDLLECAVIHGTSHSEHCVA